MNDAPAQRVSLRRADHVLAALLLSAMVLISFINVLGRYIFHYSLAFTEELTVQLFVFLVVVGSGLAFERGAHLGMTTALRYFPPSLRLWCERIGAALSAGLFLTINFLLLGNIYRELTVFHAKSAALRVPVWIYYAGVILLSPFVFRGILRGTARRSAGGRA